LNHKDVAGAVALVKKNVMDLVEGKMTLSQLTITKSLRSEYKTTPPAHKALADRIAVRDPGNAPASGERVGYVYIQSPTGQAASKLQGDRVETPEFIVANGLKPDAEYYINHQLYNPLSQLFGLMLEKMPGFVGSMWNGDPDKREEVAGDLLFKEGLAACATLAKRQFVGKMFNTGVTSGNSGNAGNAGNASAPPSSMPRKKAPVDETLLAAEAAAFGAGNGSCAKKPMFKQTALPFTAFQKSVASTVDEMMVKKMKAARNKGNK
jgi:hypothetical protein